MQIVIGVDIGGSHISSAAVDLSSMAVIPGTSFHGAVNSKASKIEIYQRWSEVINQSLASIHQQEILGIGMAIPGPFRYRDGIALFERNDKYESLYEACLSSDLPKYLNKDVPLRFLNDASAFAIGGALLDKAENKKRVTAITLGTGFGAAFLVHGIPVVHQDDVPEGGCLWDKPFCKGIADDYFSTRWFVSRFKELSGRDGIAGVKEITIAKDFDSSVLFKEFAENLGSFMVPYLQIFDTDLLIIGGSITKSQDLFLPIIQNIWKENNLEVPMAVVKNTEEAGIIGSAHLFNEDFWSEIKGVLPER